MDHKFTSQDIPLKDLALHPANVRAGSPETYDADNIAHLAASIAALGLLHPLIVQRTDSGFGVLAGGRRLAALKALAADKKQKRFGAKTKITCHILPADCAITTAISLAENVTQAAMSPIDQFEAFARMMEVDGQSVATIAQIFGTTETAVKERLRYGLVHGEIRAAVRAKEISLDVMKAFAAHPDPAVQIEAYGALKESGELYAHAVRRVLNSRGVQISDALGALVADEYQAHGGAVAADLIPEYSVLEDKELVEALLEDKLRAAAEAERARLGFAWAEIATSHDWQMFQPYGRVYPIDIAPDEAGQARLEAIAAEVTALEERQADEACPDDEHDAIYDQIDALNAEADDLQTGYAPEDLARAGVFATWNNGIVLTAGLIRPEDRDPKTGAREKTKPADDGSITYAQSLKDDLSGERGQALAAALAQSPKVATDLALFKIVTDAVLVGTAVTYGFGIDARVEHFIHNRKDEIDPTAADQMQSAYDALDLGWAGTAMAPADQFAGFRALTPTAKAKLVAYALARTTKPCMAREGHRDPLMQAIEQEVMPDIRAHWAPNGAFFGRLKKAQLLRILATDLGLAAEAANLASAKKADIVDFLTSLFAEPFATLTEAQRAAVARWCPPRMQTLHPDAEAEADRETGNETGPATQEAA